MVGMHYILEVFTVKLEQTACSWLTKTFLLIFQQDSNKLIFLDVDEMFSGKKLHNSPFNTINIRGSVNSKRIII